MESTKQLILDTALSLIQIKGYNGFSYRIIAEKIGIRAASIHYHFPRKCDLVKFLIVDYKNRFRAELRSISRDSDNPRIILRQFAHLFQQTLIHDNRMCLCVMLAIDSSALPLEIVEEVLGFIKEIEQWLTQILAKGHMAGSLKFEGSPEDQAKVTLAVIEGAMIGARLHHDHHYFEQVIRQYLATLYTGTDQ